MSNGNRDAFESAAGVKRDSRPKCPHDFIINDPDPHQLCPFCPQPNRTRIVKEWEKRKLDALKPKP